MAAVEASVRRWMATQLGVALDAAVPLGALTDSVARIRGNFEALAGKGALDVLFYSQRKEYFDATDLQGFTSKDVRSVTFCGDIHALPRIDRKFDLIIACQHAMKEHMAHLAMRSRGLAPLLVVWTWDNHHMRYENLCYNALADLVLPGHRFCAEALKSPRYVLGRHVPLCTGQWSRALAGSILQDEKPGSRSDGLYGGYIHWPGFARNEPLRALQREIPGNHLRLIEDADREQYFGLSAEARFRDWAAHKVSLNIALSDDLSLRLFDALLAGQIPIVAGNCHDLDGVIPPEVQGRLGILRVPDIEVASVTAAWREAVRRFDAMGVAGVQARHAFARDFHHVTSRVQQIVEYVIRLRDAFEIDLRIDEDSLGLIGPGA